MPHDEHIHGYLERGEPSEFDAFRKAIGHAVRAAMPALLRRAQFFGFRKGRNDADLEELVQRTYDRALVHLTKQFNGDHTSFCFTRTHALSFERWLLQILGQPNAGPRSGVVGEMLQERRRKNAVIDDTVEAADVEPFGGFTDVDSSPCDGDIEHALTELEPRQRFAIRLAFGLHDFQALSPAAVRHLAQSVGFDRVSVNKIARRASTLQRADGGTCLGQREAAALLDITDRQLRNIVAEARERIRLSLNGTRLGENSHAHNERQRREALKQRAESILNDVARLRGTLANPPALVQ